MLSLRTCRQDLSRAEGLKGLTLGSLVLEELRVESELALSGTKLRQVLISDDTWCNDIILYHI